MAALGSRLEAGDTIMILESMKMEIPVLCEDGGTLTEIEYTLNHGIRWQASDETRVNYMPAFQGVLDAGQAKAVAGHVLSLSGKAKANPAGAQTFADNCAACHGAGGEGMPAMGAPALNDAIWLYGGSEAAVTIRIGMPPSWA